MLCNLKILPEVVQKLDNLFIYLTHLDIPNSLKNKLMIIVVRIKLAFIENRIITFLNDW